jgi:Icc-related predicted phosphoesterase
MAGDIVQNGNVLQEWSALWWKPIADSGLGATVPTMIARGNHDKEYAYAYAYAAMPENGAWYSFRYGPVFFVVLDSNFSATNTTRGQDQAGYLRRVLSRDDARTAAFRVVVFHNAPFNSIQTSEDPTRNSWGWEHARETLVPIIEEKGVELVVSGHYHTYQRGARGLTRYVVIGGGGASLLGDVVGGPHQDMWRQLASIYHYAVMDVDAEGLHWRTYNEDDEQVDAFTIPHHTPDTP